MATSSLHPHSSNPFRDPNRAPGTLTPQATGSTTTSTNPFLSPSERLSPQATGASQYYTPPASGGVTPLASTSSISTPLQTQNTGSQASASHVEPAKAYAPPPGPPPSSSTTSLPQTTHAPPPGPPPQQSYAPPPGPPPQSPPRPPSPSRTLSITEAPPPYTPAADVRHGEIPLETGPRRAYAPGWHPDGQTWRNETVLTNLPSPTREEPSSSSWMNERPSSASPSTSTRPTVVISQDTGTGSSSGPWSAYPGQRGALPPPSHPSLGRSNTTAGTMSRTPPGPPTTVPTPGRALLHQGKVLAYPAHYECNRCHLTGYVAYDPSNPCRECWSLFAQPYEGIITFAPWDSPESVMTDEQNLQRPLPGSGSRTQPRPQQPPANPPPRPLSHPQYSSYAGLGQAPGSLPPAGWSATNLRPAHSVSYSGRPPPGSLVVRPGDPRIGGRVCWKCSGDGWTYKSMGLETKTCRACGGLGRLF